jgi:proline dehydrogenase
VLPYLGRRAIENKALLSGDSGTTAERRRVVIELKRRIGWSSQHKQM